MGGGALMSGDSEREGGRQARRRRQPQQAQHAAQPGSLGPSIRSARCCSPNRCTGDRVSGFLPSTMPRPATAASTSSKVL